MQLFPSARLYERLLLEKDRQIDILAEQIDWLRAQLALAGRAVPAPLNPSAQPAFDPVMGVKPYVSDEEVDFEIMRDSGQLNGLTQEQVAEIVEGLGLAPEFDLDTITIE